MSKPEFIPPKKEQENPQKTTPKPTLTKEEMEKEIFKYAHGQHLRTGEYFYDKKQEIPDHIREEIEKRNKEAIDKRGDFNRA